MQLRSHIEIGLLALRRGYLDLGRLAQAVADLQASGQPPGAEYWLGPGLMTERQLDEVLATVAASSRFVVPSTDRAEPHTAVVGVGPTLFQAGRAHHEPPIEGRSGDRYTELGVLGTGGMGAVIECIDRDLGRRVALKMLKAELEDDGAAARMLEREARVTGSLEHPNIVPVYDVGVSGKGAPFYVMRLVEQPTLGDVLGKLGDGDTEAMATYSLGRLLRHFIQICETVDYAHSRGVVHCDLKPANVLLGSFGEVLVLDWGLAYRAAEGTEYRGGTPGYMAPEQLDPARKAPIDARTDVYALGVILWEMITLESHGTATVTTVMRKPTAGVSPVPQGEGPGRRPPPTHLPAELAEICGRALEPDPEKRYASARDLAKAVAAFLEGTREKERRQQRAAELIQEADGLAAGYFEFLETRPERLAELDLVRARIAPWEPPAAKRALWDEEDRLAVTDALGVRTLHAAAAAYEQALDEVPGHPAARAGLARLYHAQLERAEERRDELDRIYFEELVKQHDDGTLLSSMRAEGRLLLEVRPAGSATVSVVDEVDRRLQPVRPAELGAAPLAVALPPGRHQLDLAVAGRAVRVPLLMRPGREARVVVDLDAGVAPPDDDEVLVVGGKALLGGESGGSLAEIDVPAFIIGRFPVTFGAYLDFLTELQREDPLRAVAHAPRGRDGVLLWRWLGDNDGEYVPARISTWSDDIDLLRRLPAYGVDAVSAEAYAAWRSRATGRHYRLPGEREWEKAGRGADGRLYPWGDRFDASFCKMRQSRPGLPRPEPVGAFAIDESPWGVRDLAGGIAEWVVPGDGPPNPPADAAQRPMVSRGGAWSDWPYDCVLTARRTYFAVERSSRVGFRLVRPAT